MIMKTNPAHRLIHVLGAMTAALSLGHGSAASATVVATMTEVGSNPITVSSDLVSCSSCIASGAVTYDFSADASVLAFTGPATASTGGYDSEAFAALGGSLSIQNGSQTLLSATFSSGTAYAVVGSSTATVEIDLTGASSTVLSLPSGNLYFDITGTTPAPVGLNASGDFTIGGLDWTAQLSTTPFSPAAVPLPGSLTLLIAGLAGLGFIGGRRLRPACRA